MVVEECLTGCSETSLPHQWRKKQVSPAKEYHFGVKKKNKKYPAVPAGLLMNADGAIEVTTQSGRKHGLQLAPVLKVPYRNAFSQ